MQIPLPSKGLNTTSAASAQPVGTSSDVLNMRPFEASSGRRRYSQRAGTSKFLSDRLASTRVDLLAQINFDSRKFTYAALDTGELVSTTLSGIVKRGVRDRQGNLIVIEGPATVVKLNDAGEVVWRLNPPMPDGRHEILAIAIDGQDNLFLGATSGGSQSTAKIWRFKPKPDTVQPVKVWEHTTGAYVRKIVVRGDRLVTLQNMPDRAQAFVVSYSGALTTGITEEWRREVSYPANDHVLKDNGDVIGCSLSYATRGLDPRFRNFTERTVDWTPKDLTDYDSRIWMWLRADEQALRYGKRQDQSGAYVDILQDGGDLSTGVFDSSGKARDWFTSIRAGLTTLTPPKYDARGIGGLPSIYFRGSSGSATYLDEIQTAGSPSSTGAYADAQRGMLPSYIGAQSVTFIVARFEDDRSAAPATRAVFGMNRATGGAGNAVSLFTNRNSAGVVAAGVGSYVDLPPATGLGLGTGGQPADFRYDDAIGGNNRPGAAGNNTGVVLLTILNDGGLNPATDNASIAHSVLRVNGQPIDRFVSASGSTIDPTYLGYFHGVAALGHFRGHIAEIIVLRDFASASQGLISHPHYPRNIGTTVANVYQAVTVTNATEMEKIEGYLAHKYGISHLLPRSVEAGGAYVPPTFGPYVPGNYPHPFYRTNGPPRAPGSTGRSEPYQMHSKNGIVWKLDGSTGALQWALTGTSAEDGGGLGTSVAVVGDAVFSVGPKLAVGSALIDGTTSAAGTGDINVRRFQDLNQRGTAGLDTSTSIVREPWIATLGTTSDDFDTSDFQIALDDYSNLYVPLPYSAIGPYTFRVYAGNADHSGASNVGNELLTYGTGTAYALVVPPSPDYRIGAAFDFDRNPLSDARQARAENVFALTTVGVEKVRLVGATPIDGTPRQTALYQVNAGVLRRFDATGIYQLLGASTVAEPQLSTTAQYIASAVLFGKLYLTDGANYFYVDPRDDSLRTWKPTDGGKMDPRNKLLVNWRGRAVIARGVDNPYIWHMSGMGEGGAHLWNQFEPRQLSTRPVSGNNSRVGLCPDVINALYPLSDDRLLFGCDHSMWVMVGDPADEGRATGFVQVSSEVGCSFGRSITMDPEGNVYWFGQQGGVYAMHGISKPVSISDDAIYAELRDIDLGKFRAELIWNTEDDCLHVYFVPFSSDVAPLHYVWDRHDKGWFQDSYATQPSAFMVSDGDLPGDRKLLIAGSDGYVRKWDRSAKSDDGEPIAIRTLLGPWGSPDADFDLVVRDLAAVLSTASDPVQLTGYASSTPDDKGEARFTFQVGPGVNRVKPVGMSGGFMWLLIEQSNPQRTVSIESLAWRQVSRGGRKRVTAT